jgi:predicted RNase H-like HicB family nuclease
VICFQNRQLKPGDFEGDLDMKELFFLVEESPEGGFTAQCIGEAIFTQGETLTELKTMILDAVQCHFDTHQPCIIRLHIVKEEILSYA